MVMRHVRGFPLVGIVEFIMYRCTRYFRERYQAAVVLLNDPRVVFCNMVTKYMKEKIEKAHYHRVVSMGTKDQRFEVLCKDRTGQGVRRQRVVQDCLITPEGKVFCKCKRPQLLHLPSPMSLRHVQNLDWKLMFLFLNITEKKPLCTLGAMRYMA